jgi:protein-L-isoaspartate(D-aspartate) O-methyltransferase
VPRSTWDAVRFRERVQDLIGDLVDANVIDPTGWNQRAWLTGLHEVPRHLFVPDRAWAQAFTTTGSDHAIDKATDPTGWWNAIYQNYSIITQRGDGTADPRDPAAPPSCSLSCPHISMAFLRLLDVRDHHRILEIGTGTGWTAAMLGWRVGDSRVSSIEVDKELAETARVNLAAVGHAPEVVTGDGADGLPHRAPFDRIHVTCGVRDIPQAWLKQVRPGGAIVAPYMPIAGAGGHQLHLDVVDEDHAVGRFAGASGFMMLRSQRAHMSTEDGEDPAELTVTRLDPRLIAEADGGAQLVIAAAAPGLVVDTGWEQHADGWSYVVQLASLDGRSWAKCLAPRGVDEYEVLQSGPRRLWDEAASAYRSWLLLGRPGRERFGLTLTASGQQIWLDSPGGLLGEGDRSSP